MCGIYVISLWCNTFRSFGVLLWELYSYGKTPYPGVENRDIANLLQTGYRMQAPECCPEQMQLIMASCWLLDPRERPTFVDICKSLGASIGNAPPEPQAAMPEATYATLYSKAKHC